MTRDEAFEVTEMILNSWTQPHWTDQQTLTYVNALVPYDAEYAVAAVALAHKTVGFRPPFSDLLKFYKAVKAGVEATKREDEWKQHAPPPVSYTRNKMPMWVKEWCCARFLYTRFGRAQDMRRFTEQGDWRDQTEPFMPPGEWSREAAHITDRDAWTAIKL